MQKRETFIQSWLQEEKYICNAVECCIQWAEILLNYTVKKGLALFPSPAGMSLTKLFLAGNNLPSPSTSPKKVWSKQIQESQTKIQIVIGIVHFT